MPSNVQKKFAAIMFTDIVGYTSQMSKDQDVALNILDIQQKAFRPILKKYNGKLVKEMGDGTLSHFSSSVDAANCSLALQKSLKKHTNLNLRVGVHHGEVLFKNKDVFGDVVNIASRLETMSPAGGVLVSKNVYDVLSSHNHDYDGISLGLQSMKGIGRLIEVFALKDQYLNIPKPEDYTGTKIEIHNAKEVPSIAIIPFDNKGKKEDEFYAYGISADIISDCSSAGLIRVASLKNIENLEYKKLNTSELASKLFVRYISTGSLWKMDNIFQLSVELYDKKDKKIIWSDRWQESWDNLPTIKGNLSDGLLKALDTTSKTEKKIETTNTAAYEFYLKAKYKYAKRTNTEDTSIARGLLQKAIDLDDNLIAAKNLMATTYREMGAYEKAMEIYSPALEQAKKNSEKYEMGNCLMCIGIVYNSKGNFDKALYYYTQSLMIKEELGDKRGMGASLGNIGILYQNKSNYDKALGYLTRSLQIHEELEDKRSMSASLNNIGLVYSNKGNIDKALDYYDRSLKICESLGDKRIVGYSLGNIGILYQNKGEDAKALDYHMRSLEICEELGDKHGQGISLNNIGNVYYTRGNYDKTLDCYTRSLEIRKELKNKRGIGLIYNNIGLVYLETLKYDKAFSILQKGLNLQKEINAIEVESIIFFSLVKKRLGKKYDKNKILSHINKSIHIEDYVNFYLYKLTEKTSYLKAAYKQVIKKADNLEFSVKTQFICYPIPQAIIKEYNKLFKK